MSDKAKPEFSLDQFSVAETDEELGIPEIKEHFADDLTPVVLRDWTAKDFASVYIRFRPHLVKYAARYLRDDFQAEEVVQDAFLYMMTALPELDSEIGVLRFLKWKTKMLALDIIRLRARENHLTLEEDLSSLAKLPREDISLSLERADDAAIVSMALAKLSVRHRTAIVETQLLEKPAEKVAAAMGLTDNAFRQLLHRARAAFKIALVGEANIKGLPASTILSLAAAKAAKEGARVSRILPVIAIVAASVSLSTIPTFTDLRDSSNLVGSEFSGGTDARRLDAPYPSNSVQAELDSVEGVMPTETPNMAEDLITPEGSPTLKAVLSADSAEDLSSSSTSESEASLEEAQFLMGEFINEEISGFVGSRNLVADQSIQAEIRTVLVSTESLGMALYLDGLDEGADLSVGLTLELDLQGDKVIGVPLNIASQKYSDEPGKLKVFIVFSEILFGDLDGSFDNATALPAAGLSYYQLELTFFNDHLDSTVLTVS